MDNDTGEILSSQNILKILKKKHSLTKITGFIMGSGKIYSVTLNGYIIVSSAVTGKALSYIKVGDSIKTSPIIKSGELYILTDRPRILGFK